MNHPATICLYTVILIIHYVSSFFVRLTMVFSDIRCHFLLKHTLVLRSLYTFRFSTSFLALSLFLWIGLRLNLHWCTLHLHVSAIYFQCGYRVHKLCFKHTCVFVFFLLYFLWSEVRTRTWGDNHFLSPFFSLDLVYLVVLAGSGVYSKFTLKFS